MMVRSPVSYLGTSWFESEPHEPQTDWRIMPLEEMKRAKEI
jgi:hypothetical protein